jgi:ArsR family transcriptional regulator
LDIAHPQTDLLDLSDRLKVLAEPKRLLIMQLLMEGIHCNCELGEVLNMTPSLISHHMRILRKAGLVDMERDLIDARWVYYLINEDALADLNHVFGKFFNPGRIKPRRPTCGPQGMILRPDEIVVVE